MLKKIIFFATSLLIIAIAGSAIAQEATDTATTVDQQAVQVTTEEPAITAQDLGVSEPTLLPDSKFYFLKNWQRAIQSTFTFGQVKKAELNLKIASEKLLEARKLSEKTDNPQILDKAAEIYNKQVDKIGNNIAKFKGTATSSEKISKFLDKYTKQQILQEQILDKLETKVPTSTMEKIQQAREKHLEKFGQVMQKLEDKDKIQQRLEKGLENLKESALKPIIKLEILKKLEDKFPTSTVQQLQQAKIGALQKLNEKLQTMPAEAQQKVENYLEKVKGAVEKKQELINEIKESLPATSTLRQKVEIIKEKLQSATTTRKYGNDCVCVEQYNPVCGADGKTYGNPCKAKCQNIAIVSQGPCGGKATTTQNVVGGDKDEHGCIGSAGYKWCELKQKCLRAWEEKCDNESGQIPAITAQDLKNGWYWGSKEQKKPGTPDTWVHEFEGTKSACWHAPEKPCLSTNN